MNGANHGATPGGGTVTLEMQGVCRAGFTGERPRPVALPVANPRKVTWV